MLRSSTRWSNNTILLLPCHQMNQVPHVDSLKTLCLRALQKYHNRDILKVKCNKTEEFPNSYRPSWSQETCMEEPWTWQMFSWQLLFCRHCHRLTFQQDMQATECTCGCYTSSGCCWYSIWIQQEVGWCMDCYNTYWMS
jgi:uncharacterized CHY-type Zn-finger protein